jgi:hypothetical protein
MVCPLQVNAKSVNSPLSRALCSELVGLYQVKVIDSIYLPLNVLRGPYRNHSRMVSSYSLIHGNEFGSSQSQSVDSVIWASTRPRWQSADFMALLS